MQFLTEYGLFLIETITIVIAIIAILVSIVAMVGKGKQLAKEHLEVTKLNDKYQQTREQLQEQLLTKKEFKLVQKNYKKQLKTQANTDRKRIFVIDFHGDLKASGGNNLRQEVTAILSIATPKDEVVARLESPGGVVHGYGLAASQLQRFKDHKIPLTVAVDKVAASGGYMMACVADKIIAAPFAIIGSIGVLLQMPNFNKWLKKHNIDFEQVTSGEYKRTLTMFGENTDKDRKKMQADLNDTHELFKEFVTTHRPQVDMDKVGTGEYWFATRAKNLNLVDELQTSDQYLVNASQSNDIYLIKQIVKKSWGKKLAHSAQQGFSKLTSVI